MTSDRTVKLNLQKLLCDVTTILDFSGNLPDHYRANSCHMTVLQQENPAATRARAHLQGDKAGDALFPSLIIGFIADRFQFVVLLLITL